MIKNHGFCFYAKYACLSIIGKVSLKCPLKPENKMLKIKSRKGYFKSHFFYVFVALSLSFLVIISSVLYQTQKRKKQTKQFLEGSERLIQETERIKLREEWFQAGEKIIRITLVQKAYNILEFVKSHNVLSEPHPKGFRVIEEAKVHDGRSFFLIPVMEADTEISYYWKRTLEIIPRKAIGIFKPEDRLLLLFKSDFFSEVFKGIILLHEGYHAEDYLSERYDWNDPNIFTYHEIGAHELQNKITLIKGGKEYEILLGKRIARLESFFYSKHYLTGDIILDFSDLSANIIVFNKVFGKSKSDIEDNFRMTSFVIHAYFIFAEKNFKDPREAKKNLMKSIYQEKGILQ